jgi:hypothetical protein
MGLFPKKIFCSLNKPVGLLPSKDGTTKISYLKVGGQKLFFIKKMNVLPQIKSDFYLQIFYIRVNFQ